MNPWLEVPLHAYEGHMAFPGVEQAEMLAREFARKIRETNPRALALIGSAGGNGLHILEPEAHDRVLCVDINPVYMQALETRYRPQLPGLECHTSEIETFSHPETVDLAFGGLIFEYTRLPEALAALAKLIRPGGHLHAVNQQPSDQITTVSPSPYATELERVVSSFTYVPTDTFLRLAAEAGFEPIETQTLTLSSGKSFASITLRKN